MKIAIDMEDNDWGQIFGFQAHHVTMIFDGTLKCRNDFVRATPKSNCVDNVRALQGDATVLEKTIKL